MKRLIFGLAFLVTYSVAANDSHADAIFVSYTVNGTPGNYDLDFSVTNNMTAWHQNVYLFGVNPTLAVGASMAPSACRIRDSRGSLLLQPPYPSRVAPP